MHAIHFIQIGHEAQAREESSDVPDGGLSEETAISRFRRERDELALEGMLFVVVVRNPFLFCDICC